MSVLASQSLPASWALARLADVATVNPTLDKSGIDDDLEVTFVPMQAVGAGDAKIDVSAERRFAEVKKGYTPFRERDVLFAKITPCMENGKVAVVPLLRNGLGYGSTEFHVLRPFLGISSVYLYHYLSSRKFRSEAERNMTGAVGQRRVPTHYLSEHRLPIPPCNEQNRLVFKLEELFSELDKAVENLAAARERLKAYQQSILKYAFDGYLTGDGNRSNWRPSRVGTEIDYLTSGSRGWAEYYSKKGAVFIRAQDLKYDRLDLEECAFVDLPAGSTEGTRTLVQRGDVLITITGANVTKTGLVDKDIGRAYVSQHVALCRPGASLLPAYLHWYLLSESGGRRQLTEAAYGAGKPGLNLENIRSVSIPVPPIEKQREVVSIIESGADAERDLNGILSQEIEKATTLRHAILKRAFSGRLVPQDPKDEPASVLLERIHSERAEGSVKEMKSRRRTAGEAA